MNLGHLIWQTDTLQIYTTQKGFIVRTAGQGEDVTNKEKLKIHRRKINVQMRTTSRWLNCGIFRLAGHVTGQKGSLPLAEVVKYFDFLFGNARYISFCWGSVR